ncbi:PREDICTED: CKLF-like MARVEL transmembrane domain-containing protein 7, partial [Chlamydotis macqueenii]|uniref:CKLF-like MARVEL transmembrane domain-containing protein 7 n=1 Tax=Chlamydotis macqueenii TaxID=187382 RepID=UPI0005295C08
ICLLIGFISVNNSPWTNYSAYSYFQIVTICDLVMILFFYIIHIFRIYRKLTCVSWPLATFGFLATVLCVLSIWSSYKVSCITQSTTSQQIPVQTIALCGQHEQNAKNIAALSGASFGPLESKNTRTCLEQQMHSQQQPGAACAPSQRKAANCQPIFCPAALFGEFTVR